MSGDTDLEGKLRSVLAGQLEGQQGRYPNWGDSPKAAAELARAAASPSWASIRGLRAGVAVVAIGLAVVLVAGVLASFARVPGGDTAGGRGGNIWAVTAFDESRVVAVGGSQDDEGSLIVARSMDGGRSWTILRPGGPALTTVTVAGTRLLGATRCTAPSTTTEAGAPTRLGPTPTSCMYVSDDGGVSWHDTGAGRLVDPSFYDESHGWARSPIDLSDPQSIYRTNDAGRSWTPLASPCLAPTPSARQIVASGPDLAFVLCVADQAGAGPWGAWQVLKMQVGATPVVLSASEGGGSYDGPATALALRPDGTGLMYAAGNIYRTTNGGQGWQPAEGGTDMARGYAYGLVLVGSSGSGFASIRNAGSWTAIEGTSDGGLTWHRLVAWDFWTGEALPPPP